MQEVTVYTIAGRRQAFVGDYMTFVSHHITPMEKVAGTDEFINVRTARPVRLFRRGHERFYVCVDPEAAEVMRAYAELDLQAELANLRQRLALAQADSRAHKSALDRVTAAAEQRAALPWWRRVWEDLRA